jgi:hypothetical protein
VRHIQAPFALIQRPHPHGLEWLARWNPRCHRYQLIGCYRHPEETFRSSLSRELSVGLGLLPGSDFEIAAEAHARYEYTAWSDTATCLTEYEVELYEVRLRSPTALARLTDDPCNRWLTEEEIQRRRCQDGRPVSVTLWHVLDSLHDNPLAEPRPTRSKEGAVSR